MTPNLRGVFVNIVGLKRILGVVAAAIALCGMAAAQANADPDNLPILHASQGDQAHACTVIGYDSSYEAVVCSDIITTYNSVTKDYTAQGRAEVICQTRSSSAVKQCDGISVVTALEDGVDTIPSDAATNWACGYLSDSGTSCSSGRNYVYAHTLSYTPLSGTCATNLDSTDQVYNVVFGKQSTVDHDTAVYLPDGAWVNMMTANDGSNQNSGHYFVCP